MKLVLIGYMGSGKSSVAGSLAEALTYRKVDLDSEIETAEKTTISDIFQSKGEIYFRRKEAEILNSLVSTNEKLVIAAGGGTPCYGTVMDDLQQNEEVVTIYLKNSLDTLTDRLFEERDTRPLIAHLQDKESLNDFIRKHLFERSYYYNQAQLTIECDGQSLNEIVEKILLQLF